MLSRQSRTARAPAGFYLPLRNFDFSPKVFCPLFCGFAEDTHPSKCIMQKLREQKIPILARAFVSAFSIFQLSFSLLFSVLNEYYSYHRMFPPLPNSLKSKQIVRLSHQSGAPRLHPHCLHRWNFRISPKKELLDEFSMGEDVSQCSDSDKYFVQVNLFSIPCFFPYLPH